MTYKTKIKILSFLKIKVKNKQIGDYYRHILSNEYVKIRIVVFKICFKYLTV